ncbi:type VI secretion system tip protein VgrG [Salmonella enterica]|nr:type VI secretion system tip protein VgrG [Salmonella enterica]EBS4388769.1 type VI secretion system tip protein VgrG [Salmonella enterica subsp. enterica serovar Panama]EBS5590097.1 type VI secretion system tip protein VgrG [Salmonella enterica subsp. enterica serovar Newport]EHJ6638752.1 type VI secretion system tip protein VgrG [Salmonella enterica subsp. enterica serovar Oranienburg]EAO7829556.1 type VI secretion system tip protein VgrG [Salmonella enterica]
MLLGQNNRYLQLLGSLSNDAALSKVEGDEYLSRPYLFTTKFYSAKKPEELKNCIGKPLGARVGDDQERRFIHGIVTELQQQGYWNGFYHYRAHLEPWLVLLKLTKNSRVYQNINVPDMVCGIFHKRGFNDVRVKLNNSYPKREFCMQYRESDFDFVTRQLEVAGIFYYFSHEQDKHVLVLADHPGAFSAASVSTLPYQSLTGQRQGVGLRAWNVHCRIIPCGAEMSGYNIKNATPVRGSAKVGSRFIADDRLSIYDVEGLEQQQQLSDRAALCLEQWESQASCARATSNYPALQVGQQFTLTGNPGADGRYAVGGQHLSAESNLESGEWLFSAQITLFAADQVWRPSQTISRPSISGVLSALVVGPSAEDIHTDDMGRIKIQFHWDKEHKKDDNSSCWIRVSQFGNGARFGAQFIPRVGNEVLVSFVDGDPDYPVVTGTVYNGVKMPPFTLPGHKTQSGVATRSSAKGSIEQGHQFCFEDKKDQEFILLSSQKDLQWKAKNDLSAEIVRDVRWDIKGKRDTHIDKGDDRLILNRGNKSETIDKGNFVIAVNSGNHRLDVSKGKVSVSAGQTCTITAKQKIELKVGGTSLVITPAGITLKGPTVNIKGDGTLKLSAASTTVEGTGMLALKSSGMTKLSGLTVQIDATTLAMLKGLLTKIG